MMTFPAAFDRFAERALSPSLSDGSFLRARALARLIHLSSDDIAKLEESDASLVFVVDGAIKLVAHTETRREQVVAFHFVGDLLKVPARGSHRYGLHALTDTDLIVLPYTEIRELAAFDPITLGKMLDSSDAALARAREKTVLLGRKSAPEKVADFLVSMAVRIGKRTSGTVTVDLPMSRRDIADSIGLTVETISRQLSKLREMGLLETTGRTRIIIHDLAMLQRLADHLPEAA